MYRAHYTLHSTLYDLHKAAKTLLHYANKQRLWLLEGDMGAGKTTLVRALCTHLDVRDNVTSPTFSLVQEYATASGVPVYHFDFYRVRHEAEVHDLDCTSYFRSGHYCFIEWPAKLYELPLPPYCKVHITPLPNGHRVLHMHCY